MTQIQLLNDQDFKDLVKISLVVVARQIMQSQQADEYKDFARQILQNPNDGGRVSTFATLIVAGYNPKDWETKTDEQKKTIIQTGIGQVFKEAGYIK